MTFENLKQACQYCLQGNQSPLLHGQLCRIFGKHQFFHKILAPIKDNNKMMTCFFLIAKEKINEGTYFHNFYQSDEIMNMLMSLSHGFSFQNNSYAYIYLQFLGFLAKEYFYSPSSTNQGIIKIFELFSHFPPLYQLKILNSILDNIKKFKSLLSAYISFWKNFSSMISKYGNILIAKIQGFLRQTAILNPFELQEILLIMEYFLKNIFENLELSEDCNSIILINVTKVDILLWVDYLCNSWFCLTDDHAVLQIQILNLLSKLVRVSKGIKKNEKCEVTMVEMAYKILKYKTSNKNKNVKSALATFLYEVSDSFSETSLRPFLNQSEIILNFCMQNVRFDDLDLQSGSNSSISLSMDVIASFLYLFIQRLQKKQVGHFQNIVWTFISTFIQRVRDEKYEINFATLRENIEVLQNYFDPFGYAVHMLNRGKVVIVKECLRIIEEENNFLVACMVGVFFRKKSDQDEETKIIQTKHFYEYFKLKNKVSCWLTKLLIVSNFLIQILNEDFVEEGEYSSYIYYLIEREELTTFEEILEDAISVLKECLDNFTQNNEKFQDQISYALDICVFVCDKLAKRHKIVHEFPTEYKYEYNFVEVIEEIFQIITNLYIFSNNQYSNLEKHYQILAILLNEYDVSTIFQVFNKLLSDFNLRQQQGILKFMVGATGVLNYLDEIQYYKIFTELLLDQFQTLNISVGSDHFLEIFINFMKSLCDKKQFFEGHSENLLRIQSIFHKALEEYLPQALKVLDLYDGAISIYKNYAKIEGINFLLDFPSFSELKIEKELLHEYFERISRVKDLSQLEEHACLSLNWMILFLEQKIEREEKVSTNFKEMMYFFSRFSKEKVRHFKNLFSHFLTANETIREDTHNSSIIRIWIQTSKLDLQS